MYEYRGIACSIGEELEWCQRMASENWELVSCLDRMAKTSPLAEPQLMAMLIFKREAKDGNKNGTERRDILLNTPRIPEAC